ncbi:MAG: hypothetical protein ACRDSN_09570 [Pseudonocardiaceae bacterium]
MAKLTRDAPRRPADPPNVRRGARVLTWLGSERLVLRPLGGTQIYDTEVRLMRRYPRFDAPAERRRTTPR